MSKKNAWTIRMLALLALAGLAVAMLAACGGTAAPATTAPSQPATIDAAALLETRCSVCHSPTRATDTTHTPAEWDQTVSRMIGKGAQLNDAEKAALVEYLAANYGK